ncbi:MAG TPA: MOSC N-terminal beta barrel domain-containing protein [Solirubrobacteraceae bacterium]|nr:MOSC N-terminal beta barrel domain-containing protein [Solirubrobacteraceae bacterium]
MRELTVTGLYTYPVKSCAGTELQQALITPRGVALDRDYMLIDEDQDFLSQRKVPELALVHTSVGVHSITITAAGMPATEIPLQIERDDTKLVTATVHGKPVTGQIVSEELNEWFSTFLPAYKHHRRYRLLHVREDLPRYVSERYRLPAASNRLGFADGSAMLLASERSLAQLNSEMAQPVPMNRFRPNIIVDGPKLEPYEEDYWTELQIGPLHAYVTKACDRCVTTDVDQNTAVTGKAVRRALTTRKGVNAYDESNKGVFFAQNLNHVYTPGITVSVGDAVRVLTRSAQPNVRLNPSTKPSADALAPTPR